jgi:hypothetical protein
MNSNFPEIQILTQSFVIAFYKENGLRKTFQQFILLKKMAIAAHFHYNVELR